MLFWRLKLGILTSVRAPSAGEHCNSGKNLINRSGFSADSSAYPVFQSTHPVCRLLARARTLALQSDLSGPSKAVGWHLRHVQQANLMRFKKNKIKEKKQVTKGLKYQATCIHHLHLLLRSCKFRLMLILMSFISMYFRLVSLFMFSSRR